MPRVTSTDEVFKKAEQVVGKPETTKHNINEEYLRNAPQVRPLRVLLSLGIALTCSQISPEYRPQQKSA
jgi:hypothetical protein